jgi:cytochrome c553
MKLLASTSGAPHRMVAASALHAAAGAQDHAVPAFSKVDSMEARVQGCVTCHGQSGQGTNSGYFPRIAGKPASYLYNQLVAFRDGTRSYAPMNYLVAYLPDAYLREMAEHYAKLRPPLTSRTPPSVDAATLARGQALVVTGDPAKTIPACAACHGKGLTGMEPGHPRPGRLAPDRTSSASSRAGASVSATPLARLHEADRGAHVRRRHHRGRCMAGVAGSAERSVAGIVQPRAHAVRVRQPALSMRKAVVFAIAAALVLVAIAATLYFFLRPGPLPRQVNAQRRARPPRSSTRVSTSPARVTASPAIPCPTASRSRAAGRWRRRSATSTFPTSPPTTRPASASGTPTSSTG